MEYELNPCEACWQKYKRDERDINTLNNCVMETAAAFAEFPSANDIGTPALTNWNDCMIDKMKEIDRTPCDFQLNKPPVFVQAPHYFPRKLYETKNKEEALKQSLAACNNSFYPSECRLNCITDYRAVTLPEKQKVEPYQYVEHYQEKNGDDDDHDDHDHHHHHDDHDHHHHHHHHHSPSPDITYEDLAKDNPVVFWLTFTVFAIVFAVILTIFFTVLFGKK